MKRPFIHYSCQSITEQDIEAVASVLRSDFLTQGPAIEAFEHALQTTARAPHAVAVSSATAGLHLACMALNLTAGDRAWTSPMSFVASANAARYLGAHIDFVDIDESTGNISPEKLEKKLQSESPPRLLIVVHYAGRACDMEEIYTLKAQYGFHLIEDAAHALGARYKSGAPVGSDPRTDATIFSFHPVKPITTGEGGAIITHNAHIAATVRALRSHGITRDAAQLKQKNLPAWYYEQQTLGFNYRMTDIQAALGASQMKRLEEFMQTRRSLAARYETLLNELPLTLPPPSDKSGWHLYPIQLKNPGLRDTVFTTLRAANIGVNVHYMPIHLHPYYAGMGFRRGHFPAAENFFDGLLTIPLHQSLSLTDQDYVAQQLTAALK